MNEHKLGKQRTKFVRVSEKLAVEIQVFPFLTSTQSTSSGWFEDRHLQEIIQLLRDHIFARVATDGKNDSICQKTGILTGVNVRLGYSFKKKPERQTCLVLRHEDDLALDRDCQDAKPLSGDGAYRHYSLYREKLVVFVCPVKDASQSSMSQLMSAVGNPSQTASISSYFQRQSASCQQTDAASSASSSSAASGSAAASTIPSNSAASGSAKGRELRTDSAISVRKRKIKSIIARTGSKLSGKEKVDFEFEEMKRKRHQDKLSEMETPPNKQHNYSPIHQRPVSPLEDDKLVSEYLEMNDSDSAGSESRWCALEVGKTPGDAVCDDAEVEIPKSSDTSGIFFKYARGSASDEVSCNLLPSSAMEHPTELLEKRLHAADSTYVCDSDEEDTKDCGFMRPLVTVRSEKDEYHSPLKHCAADSTYVDDSDEEGTEDCPHRLHTADSTYVCDSGEEDIKDCPCRHHTASTSYVCNSDEDGEKDCPHSLHAADSTYVCNSDEEGKKDMALISSLDAGSSENAKCRSPHISKRRKRALSGLAGSRSQSKLTRFGFSPILPGKEEGTDGGTLASCSGSQAKVEGNQGKSLQLSLRTKPPSLSAVGSDCTNASDSDNTDASDPGKGFLDDDDVLPKLTWRKKCRKDLKHREGHTVRCSSSNEKPRSSVLSAPDPCVSTEDSAEELTSVGGKASSIVELSPPLTADDEELPVLTFKPRKYRQNRRLTELLRRSAVSEQQGSVVSEESEESLPFCAAKPTAKPDTDVAAQEMDEEEAPKVLPSTSLPEPSDRLSADASTSDVVQELWTIYGDIRDVSLLSRTHLEEIVRKCRGHLTRIFQGKVESRRHDLYKKGGLARLKLNNVILATALSEEQQDAVMDTLMSIFCQKHHRYLQYLLKVLLPEMIISIYMLVHRLSHFQTERMLLQA